MVRAGGLGVPETEKGRVRAVARRPVARPRLSSPPPPDAPPTDTPLVPGPATVGDAWVGDGGEGTEGPEGPELGGMPTGGTDLLLPGQARSVEPGGPYLGPMRLGVIDIGSNTVHLLVVDAHRGGQPLPAASVKEPLRLVELLDDGALTAAGERTLTACIQDMRRHADDLAVSDLVAFATSALRDATNSEQVLARLRAATGVELEVLPGEDEARLTFLAVRRWFGWSAGRLLALDIGGGSLEIAAGMHEDPDVVASLPLGATRLTRAWLAANDPPKRAEVAALRRYVRAQIAPVVASLYHVGEPTRAVATSKTFRSLARIAGAASYSRGPYVRRELHREALAEVTAKLCRMPSAQRLSLPGVSEDRAAQLAAGAVVATEAMDLLGVDTVEICPWALREGVILRRLDWLTFR